MMKTKPALYVITPSKARRDIDKMIRCWREVYRHTKGQKRLIASCYVDAYQCARTMLFGEQIP